MACFKPFKAIRPNKEFADKVATEKVLMPGDPLRAKYIAENFLDNYKMVNSVRNIYTYTGTYKGKELTVMASGMGIPSIGIYAYELYQFYDVKKIIRVGTIGAMSEDIKVKELIIVDKVFSNTNYNGLYGA